MIDLNAILTTALTQAVAEAIKPLEERLSALEAHAADAITADQVSHLIDEAIDEIDWPERVRDALNSIDLNDHADIDTSVREAINDIDWAEQIDLSQLRIVIER
jgi:hypothetical protein